MGGAKKLVKKVVKAHGKVLDPTGKLRDTAEDVSGITAKKEAAKAAAAAKREAEKQSAIQERINAKAEKEQAREREINAADAHRTDAKSKKRKARSSGGGSLMTGGDTGISSTKTKLGS